MERYAPDSLFAAEQTQSEQTSAITDSRRPRLCLHMPVADAAEGGDNNGATEK